MGQLRERDCPLCYDFGVQSDRASVSLVILPLPQKKANHDFTLPEQVHTNIIYRLS